MAKTINMECPICKKKVLFVGVHDDEGNYHGLVGCEYENDPWSSLSYALHHEGWGDCPLCTDGAYSTMGGMLFDTAEEAINALTPPNEWVSVEERLPEVGQEVLVYWRNTSQKAEHFELTHYDGDHWFLLDNTERPWIVVVAWTPLPAPPAKEGDR